MNNGKYETEQFKSLQKEKQNRQYGPITTHQKICERCNETFTWKGRRKTKAYEKARFCSRRCANNRQSHWDKHAKCYRVIAFRHWDKACIVCGHNKVVEVHHLDGDRENNEPTNLVPLCPTHHVMMHRKKWRGEILPQIKKVVNEKFGLLV